MGQDGGDLVELTPQGYHRAQEEVHAEEVRPWEPYFNSRGKSFVNWEGELWAGPGVVPSLVQELALSLLRSLLVEDSQASLALAAVEAEAVADSLVRLEDVEERL